MRGAFGRRNGERSFTWSVSPSIHSIRGKVEDWPSSGSDQFRRLESGSMPGQTKKQRALEAVSALPEDATLEDAIERLCFLAKIEEGLRQSDAGELVAHEEVKKQFLS